MNYLFCFDKFSWKDKIFLMKLDKKYKIWDLMMIWDSYYINIWKNISFPELYKYELNPESNIEVVYKNFLYKETIELINFLVYIYYTTYKNIFPLFLNIDISKLMIRKKSQSRKIKYNNVDWDDRKNKLIFSSDISHWQQLIVFPDLRTLTQSLEKEKLWKDITINSWKNTIKQKDDLFRNIKTWKTTTLISTYSQIFKDWKNLKKIIIIDNHKWYYKNQQDPRYQTNDVLKKMSKIYNCLIERYGLRNLIK